jgi:hypothetical protein
VRSNDKELARRHIADEARSLLTRLGRVRPFALQETMLPAAALAPQALVAIEHFLVGGRFALREQVREFLRWLDGPGRGAPPDELQRRYTIVRLAFNDALSQFDTFSEVVTQRSEAESGVWLSGLDVLAADALALPGYFEPPPVVCYLARGPGAAIRRARTRVPGGGSSPVAIVRVPRERMVGYGIGSSLVHEVGHQAAALLGLVATAKSSVDARARQAPPAERRAWELWSRWISEIVADLWSVGKLGIGSTLGLAGVVSLPSFFVFRIATDDPHPAPWIRVVLSCAVGDALYPHAQWRRLATMWEQLYPPARLSAPQRTQLDALRGTTPQLARLLVEHRPASLRGRSIREVMPVAARQLEGRARADARRGAVACDGGDRPGARRRRNRCRSGEPHRRKSPHLLGAPQHARPE